MNKTVSQGKQKDKGTRPPPELIEQFLHLQTQELEIRSQELQLDFQREKNNKSVAEISIDANLRDRANQRQHLHSVTKLRMIGFGIMFVVACGVICYSLYLNKEQLLIKVFEVISYLVAGFAAGYGYRSAKKQKPAENNNGIDIE
jgi:hypothetical protein